MKKLKEIKIQKIYLLLIVSFFIISFFQIIIGGLAEPLMKKVLLEPLPKSVIDSIKKVCRSNTASNSSEKSLLNYICLNFQEKFWRID